jgi:hypothetical protein
VAGDWKRLHNGKIKNAYTILVGKHEWWRLLGKSRHRWEDNIINDLA